jgi:hypothetical protein
VAFPMWRFRLLVADVLRGERQAVRRRSSRLGVVHVWSTVVLGVRAARRRFTVETRLPLGRNGKHRNPHNLKQSPA